MEVRRVRPGRIRITELVGVLVGLGMFLARTLGKSTAQFFPEYTRIDRMVQWEYVVGSCVFVSGLITPRDGRWRSVLPVHGFVAPVPVMATWLLARYVHLPPTDWQAWTPTETVFHAIVEMFTRGGGVLIATLLFGIGIAVARKKHRWVARGLGVESSSVASVLRTSESPGPSFGYRSWAGSSSSGCMRRFTAPPVRPRLPRGRTLADQPERSNSFANSKSRPNR